MPASFPFPPAYYGNLTAHGGPVPAPAPTPSPVPFQAWEADSKMQTASAIALISGITLFAILCVWVALTSAQRASEEVSLQAAPSNHEILKRRKEFVKVALIQRDWDTSATEDPDSSDQSVISTSSTSDGQRGPTAIPTGADASNSAGTDDEEEKSDQDSTFFDDANGCIICLTAFQTHDRVCESNGGVCQHIFHQACMENWLLRHEACPVCRETYLVESV
jgi:hypothetical protein|uniref:RING-type domain-containing protein n=1 Tax=Phaeodactylum tricornutum TaxID=2850 RepID=A0A8J9SK80_PHATR